MEGWEERKMERRETMVWDRKQWFKCPEGADDQMPSLPLRRVTLPELTYDRMITDVSSEQPSAILRRERGRSSDLYECVLSV